MKKGRERSLTMVVSGVILALFVLQATATWAGENSSSSSTASEVGLGASSILLSLPYGAVKVSTAIIGGVVGGMAYVLSGFDKRVADSVWYTTIDGDYVITPDHLKGNRPLRFTGVPPEDRRVGQRHE